MAHFLKQTIWLLNFTAVCAVAQVDIYQSDAYSVEEMCAREAEQNATPDYSTAYDQCLEKNRDNPMYRPGSENDLTESEPTPDSTAHTQDYKDPEATPSHNR